MNPFKTLFRFLAALDSIVLIALILIVTLVGIPSGLFHVYKLSADGYLWLFGMNTALCSLFAVYSFGKFKKEVLSKFDFLANVAVVTLVSYGSLGLFLTAVRA